MSRVIKYRPVHFVFDQTSRYSGSTVMRGEQLSKIARKILPRQEVFFTSSHHILSNSILFLTKAATRYYGPEGLSKLNKRDNTIIIDPIDSPLTADLVHYADIIVAASEKALYQYQNLFSTIPIMLVDHHVDPRIKNVKTSQITDLRIGYFGELFNTYSTKEIKQKVDFFRVNTIKQGDSWFNKLPNYNMHYAIRIKSNPNRHKPFLKGFIAAHCNSNIIIQESETDVIRWLGDDYPYLFRGNISEDEILQAIEYVEDSFMSKEWYRGLERMRQVKEKTSESVIRKQLLEVFKSIQLI